PSAEVRISSLRAIRAFRDPEIIDYLKPFLADPDPRLRAHAISALWRFPWERTAYLQDALDRLFDAEFDSEPHRQGLYLIAVLHLRDRKKMLKDALGSADMRTSLTAAIALLKLGDAAGIGVLEQALSLGGDRVAYEVERLEHHPNVPEAQQ